MELDIKDRKLLTELELNARISHAELAKKIRVSKQVVKYRVERLEEQGIIQGYNAIIDVNALGLTFYLIYFKLIQLSSREEEKWIQEINSHPNVALTAKNAGNWDLTVVIICSNNQELDSILKEITENKLMNIKEKLITSEIESTYFQQKLFMPAIEGKEINTSRVQQEYKLGRKDQQLLILLSANCQQSLLELGSKVKMSANGIKERMKKLEQQKIILGYKTKINYDFLRYLHFRVLVQVINFSPQLYIRLKQFLKEKGNVESISRYVGYADIDFRCHTKDILEFYSLISELKDEFVNEINSIDSMLIFEWQRINYYPI